jgi:hypothetical protein
MTILPLPDKIAAHASRTRNDTKNKIASSAFGLLAMTPIIAMTTHLFVY